ncbi:DNA polymerase III subunit delta' [Oceanobacillus alkalisoli]|uniref:DNA polymerase III subunit delta' n=1 Tax=Oceanobacillus alkalisoli TaxID=2925113 RepID=UPI001F119B98|nr:DNA polymerase III subunit delta' [Oceanobacillus alkalisoli]MCF3944072.1 DNA polymerase III subunit delta' [Oceanobacillus alkalisoli]
MNNWSELVEIQPLATQILTNSITKGRISHAYLLQGERGTGKEQIALVMAKSLFCENRQETEPCNTCNNCKRITSGNHPDVHWIEPEGLSISKEQVQHLQKEFSYSGMESNQKVYVVKHADRMTVNAANSLLKFLEEPSKQTTAMMLTENSGAILATIRSRCQVIDLKPLNPLQFQKQLVTEGMREQDATLMSALTNNLDDAFQVVQDEWFVEARKLVLQLIEMLTTNHDNVYLYLHSKWLTHFKEREDHDRGLDILLLALRDVLYYHIGNEGAMTVFKPADALLEKSSMKFSQHHLSKLLDYIIQAKRKLSQNVQPTLVMEQLVLQMKR